jgi:transposase
MAMRSGIAPMKAKAKMLQSHRDLILNYFRAKKEYSSAVVEGLNTKVKLVTRKAFTAGGPRSPHAGRWARG